MNGRADRATERRNRGPGRQLYLTNVDALISVPCPRPASIRPIGGAVAAWRVEKKPDLLWSIGRDAHLHLHAEMVRRNPMNVPWSGSRGADRARPQGDKSILPTLPLVGRNRSSRRRQINLRPGMGRSRAEPLVAPPNRRADGEIPGCKRAANRASAPPRSSAWRNRGSCHGEPKRLTGCWIPFAPAAGSGSHDGCPVTAG